MRPFMDKAAPDIWKSAQEFSATVRRSALERGITADETELIKVRASQMNGCAFCLDLHSRQARQSGVSQQKLDVLPSWRESDLYSGREQAILAITEVATRLRATDNDQADLEVARSLLGDDTFAAAEWVAVTINMFNRISILSQHPVRPRDAAGKVIR